MLEKRTITVGRLLVTLASLSSLAPEIINTLISAMQKGLFRELYSVSLSCFMAKALCQGGKYGYWPFQTEERSENESKWINEWFAHLQPQGKFLGFVVIVAPFKNRN